MKIRRFSTTDIDFDSKLKALLAFETAQDDSVDEVVASILKDVKKRGDAAVLEYTNSFDKTNASHLSELRCARGIRPHHLALPGDVPSFIAETRFSEHAFRLFRWRSPETRQALASG